MLFIRLMFEAVGKVTLAIVFVIIDFFLLFGVVEWIKEQIAEYKAIKKEKENEKVQDIFRPK